MQTLRKFTVPRRISLSNFNLASIANLPSAVPSINRRFDNVLILNVWWTDGRETKEKEDTVNDKKEKKGQKKELVLWMCGIDGLQVISETK
jgi:hypothetical protein